MIRKQLFVAPTPETIWNAKKAAGILSAFKHTSFSSFMSQIPEFERNCQRATYKAEYSSSGQNRVVHNISVSSTHEEAHCYEYGCTIGGRNSIASFGKYYDIQRLLSYSLDFKREDNASQIKAAVERINKIEVTIQPDKASISLNTNRLTVAANYRKEYETPSLYLAVNHAIPLFKGQKYAMHLFSRMNVETNRELFKCDFPGSKDIMCGFFAEAGIRARVERIASEFTAAVAGQQRIFIAKLGYVVGDMAVGIYKYIGEPGVGLDVIIL